MVDVTKAAILLAAALIATPTAAQTTGQQSRLVDRAGAAVRDARHRDQMRVTVWYPAATGAALTSLDIGPRDRPLFRLGPVAIDAPFADDRRRPVILLSHGYGGTARTMAWFGKAMVERGYVVIGVDHPGNNGIDEMTVPGAVLWGERAEDLKAALAAALADPALSAHLDPGRIGVAGFSIGGLTALVAGGARVSPENIVAFCGRHPGDGVCQPQIEFPLSVDEWSRALASDALSEQMAVARDDHSLPGVRAVFAMAPVVQVADPTSLAAIDIPVAIVSGADDVTVPPATHARVAVSMIPGSKLEIVPEATHYSFLARCTPHGRAEVPVCEHAEAQDAAHRRAIAVATALFDRALR